MVLFDLLKFEEGYREKAYYCSEGYPTIGIGTKIGPKGAPLEHYTLRVSEALSLCMLNEEVKSIRDQLVKFSWYRNLDEDRQIIIKSMCYQMGVSGVLKFKKMIAALEKEDYKTASIEALDSRWAKQTKSRASRHSMVLSNGNLTEVYGDLIH